jgi:hypothetical protein
MAARNEIFEAVEAEVVTFRLIDTGRLAFLERRDLFLRTIFLEREARFRQPQPIGCRAEVCAAEKSFSRAAVP